MHISNIVSGDLIQIFNDMDIPADGYIIEGCGVTTDESAITGEIDPIKKAKFSECVQIRDQIVAESGKITIDKYEVPSPVILSGTKVHYFT